MKNSDHLIILVKNTIPGKVKTRLAANIGDKKALEVYQQLLRRTYEVTKDLICSKTVCYDQYLEKGDMWDEQVFQKKVQQGNDLGQRMLNAFQEGFKEGYTKISLVGSDCDELTSDIIYEAYSKLELYDLVIGPACDGGYYLIAMKRTHAELFENKPWSTKNLLNETLMEAQRLSLKCFLLPELNDIDEYEDLLKSNIKF